MFFHKMQRNYNQDAMLFPKLRSEKVAPAGQLVEIDPLIEMPKVPKIKVFCLY